MKITAHIYGKNAMDQTLEVEATELTEHFCIAHIPDTEYTEKTDTFTHIPSGWRIGNHLHWRKKEALPKAEALEKLDVNWDNTETNYYGSLSKDILSEIRAIFAGMSIG